MENYSYFAILHSVIFAYMTKHKLIEIEWPDFGICSPPPKATAKEFQLRINHTLDAMKERKLTHLVIYGDREHFANLMYLTGFDPRFEEALLILSSAQIPLLVVGNECEGYLTVSPLYEAPCTKSAGYLERNSSEANHPSSRNASGLRNGSRRLHPCGKTAEYSAKENNAGKLRHERFQPFSLLNQPRDNSRQLSEILASEGINKRSLIGCVGWKYFSESEHPAEKYAIDIPSYIADTLRDLTASDKVINTTDIFMHPDYGLRTFASPSEIAYFEFTNILASEGMRGKQFLQSRLDCGNAARPAEKRAGLC
jgi:hypothetical protein